MVMFALWLRGHALSFWVTHATHHGVMLQGKALPHWEGGHYHSPWPALGWPYRLWYTPAGGGGVQAGKVQVGATLVVSE